MIGWRRNVPQAMRRVTSEQEVDTLFEQARVILYKHSTRCPVSSMAYDEVEMFLERHPDAPVYMVDVIAHRSTSRYAAAKAGITHHSPQVIFLREGAPVWDTSHEGVTTGALERQWNALR